MPELESFPKSHQVTFKYYVGVILFLEENYAEVLYTYPQNSSSQWLTEIPQAEKHLTEAWSLCHNDATRNKEWVTYLLLPQNY